MFQHTQSYDVQANHLSEMQELANKASASGMGEGPVLLLTRLGGINMIPEEVVDGPIPGVLIEGVAEAAAVEQGDTVVVTVWTDGRMADFRVDPETEVRVRMYVESVACEYGFPKLERCGRCNRNIVPSEDPHVGC